MASQKTKLTVGLFVFFGISIALLAFIWLGMSRFLEKGQYYAIYFNETVQGLDKDSPVKYRGVSVGRVSRIEVAPDSKLIQVIVKVDKTHKLGENIVARLSVVGITGSMIVELDLKEPEEEDKTPELSFPSEFPILSSKPSNISEILDGIDDFLDQIKALELKEISRKINITLDNFNQLMADANIKELSTTLESSFKDIGKIVERERWDTIISSIEGAVKSLESVMSKADGSIDKVDSTLTMLERLVEGEEKNISLALHDFREAMKKINTLMGTGNSMITGADDSIYELGQSLNEIANNIERATENLNRITDIVTDQPSQLLFGEPRTPKKIEE